jgi:hypothetical protein
MITNIDQHAQNFISKANKKSIVILKMKQMHFLWAHIVKHKKYSFLSNDDFIMKSKAEIT